MTTGTGRPKGVPKKGQKLVNGEWVWPTASIAIVVGTDISTPTITTTNAQPSVTLTHHDLIHPRKGMTPYERRNWLNARAGWPVRKG